jgi:hypothetical protein
VRGKTLLLSGLQTIPRLGNSSAGQIPHTSKHITLHCPKSSHTFVSEEELINMAQDGTLPVRGRQMSQNNKSNNRRRSKSQSGKNGDAPNKRAADTANNN